MLLRSMQNTRRSYADAKAENDALRDARCVNSRRLHIKAVCQSVREATIASGVDNAASPDWQTPLNGIISPSERGWSLCKNNWKEPRSILMSSADRVAHIDGQLMQLLWVIHTRFQRSINAQSNKTEQSIYECLLGFCFNNIFCAAINFGCIDSFLSKQPRNEEMMGDGFGATAAGLFWTVNVCWAHPVISRASAVARYFFHGVIPDAFWSSQNRMCRKLNNPKQWVEISYC